MAVAGSFYATFLCVIHEYHVYKDVWSPDIGESFVCLTEDDKIHDKTAVGVNCSEGFLIQYADLEFTKQSGGGQGTIHQKEEPVTYTAI